MLCCAEMMESCFGGKPDRVGPVVVDDIKRDLLREFTALPQQVTVSVSLSPTVSVCSGVRSTPVLLI